MKRLLWTALLAVPCLATPARAPYFCPPQGGFVMPPVKLDGGITLNFNLWGGGGRTQLGPWYQYWPYEAHFQAPPPLGASMPGPSFMTLPPQHGMPQAYAPQQQPYMPPAPQQVPPGQQVQQSVFQPVGYWTTGTAPRYWYGR